MQTVFCSRALTDYGFENASAKCGLSRLDGLSACSSVFTEARVSIEPEANSCEIRGMMDLECPLLRGLVEMVFASGNFRF